MFAIIKNIPTFITVDDLAHFVTPSKNRRFFLKKGSIQAVKIIKVIDENGNQVERHGIVRVYPDGIKKRLISSLNGRLLGDIVVNVKDYTIRDWHNDRRANVLRSPSIPNNVRKVDRRRNCLKKVGVSEKLISKPISFIF